jgi:hypothetical protein
MRRLAYAAGAALAAFGVFGLLQHASDTHPIGWFVWFAGAAVAHDVLVAPLVIGTGLLVTRLPRAYRHPARTALVLAGAATIVAVPMVLGFGRRPDNPSILPQAYGTHLTAIAIFTGVSAAAIALLNAYSHSMGRAILTVIGVLLAIWFLFTIIGMLIAALKFLIWLGVLAVVAAVIVTIVARLAKSRP